MKKVHHPTSVVLGIMLLFCTFTAQAVSFSEDFSTLPAGKFGAVNTVTLSLNSGDWQA